MDMCRHPLTHPDPWGPRWKSLNHRWPSRLRSQPWSPACIPVRFVCLCGFVCLSLLHLPLSFALSPSLNLFLQFWLSLSLFPSHFLSPYWRLTDSGHDHFVIVFVTICFNCGFPKPWRRESVWVSVFLEDGLLWLSCDWMHDMFCNASHISSFLCVKPNNIFEFFLNCKVCSIFVKIMT